MASTAPAMTGELPPTGHEDPPWLPSPGFDPVNNAGDAAKLSHFWLPSRPDPDAQPELYAHWEEMFWPLPTFVYARSEKPAPAFLGYVHQPNIWNVASRLESSLNWSGAYLDCKAADRFARVVGAWEIPTVKPGVRDGDDSRYGFQCSMWIGLDGKKHWTKSMPQVGSEQGIKNDKRTQHLWWQWWQRRTGDPELPYTIKGVPIEAGDRVLCSLSVMSAKYVRIHVVNRTTGLFATVQLKAGEPVLGGTAEWVVERQSDFVHGPDFLYPLPDYKEAIFDHCAVENHDAVSSPPWVPRYIRMTQILRDQGRQARAVVISRPSMNEAPRKVRLNYQRPGDA